MADPLLERLGKEDGVTVTPVTRPATAPTGFTMPPPGYGRALQRGIAQGMSSLDQTAANLFSVGGSFPNFVSTNMQSDADRRRAEVAAIDQAGDERPSTGQRIVAETTGAVIGALPYIAGGTVIKSVPLLAGISPIRNKALGSMVENAIVGAVENADQGPAEMAWGAAKAAGGALAGTLTGGLVVRGVNATPAVRSAPSVVKRAMTGAITGAAVGSAGSGGDPIEAASQGIAGAAFGAASRGAKKGGPTPDEVRANKFVAALGPNTPKGFKARDAYLHVIPHLDETVAATGKTPLTISDHKENVDTTIGRLESVYQKYLRPIKQDVVDPTEIADKIQDRITPEEARGKTKAADIIAKDLNSRSNEYRRPWRIIELEAARKRLFEARTGKSAEGLQSRSDGEVRADRIAEDAIRDFLYKRVDAQAQLDGRAPGYVANDLKLAQAKLIALNDILIDRAAALENQDAARKGTPWWQKTNLTTAVHPSGGIVTSIHGVTPMVVGDKKSLKSVNKLVKSAYTSRRGNTATSRPPRDFVPSLAASGWNDRNKQQQPADDEGMDVAQKEFLRSMGAVFPTAAPPVAK